MNIDKEQRATVWNVEKDRKTKKTYVGKISTYEGEDAEGKPSYSSWYAKFRSKAYTKAAELEDGDKIVLDLAKITSYYDKDKKSSFVYITVFNFHIWEDEGKAKKKSKRKDEDED